MKTNLGKRSVALVLCLMLVMTMTPAKMVIADESVVAEKAALTIETALTNCNVGNVTVKEGEQNVTPEQGSVYNVTPNTKITVSVEVTPNSNYTLKASAAEGWSKADEIYTYTYEAGICEATKLSLADDLFVEQTVVNTTAVATEVTVTKNGNGSVNTNGSAVEESIAIQEDTTFELIPEVGFYVANVKVGGQNVEFSAGSVKNNGAYEITYLYSDEKATDTIEVEFAAISTSSITELGDWGVASDAYYVSGNDIYVKDNITLQKSNDKVMVVSQNESSYNFTDDVNIGAFFSGNIYTLNTSASGYAGVISGYTLTTRQDDKAPVIKTKDGSDWSADQKAWMGGNQTGGMIQIRGKISDESTGIKSTHYVLADSEPLDWDSAGASELSLVDDGSFSIELPKNQVAESTTVKCYIRAVDYLGNAKTVMCSFAKDETVPELEISVNEKKGFWIFVKDTVKVTVTATDEIGESETEASGIDADTFKVYVDGTEQVIDGTDIKKEESNGTYTITINNAGDADHTVTAEVYDKAGNYTTTAENKAEIRYDNKKPVFSSVRPAENTNLTKSENTFYYKEAGQLSFDLQMKDDVGIKFYKMETESGVILTDTNYPENQTKTITHVYVDASQETIDYHTDETINVKLHLEDTSSLTTITCTLTVEDLAGNIETQTVSFEQDTEKPQFDTTQSSIRTSSDGDAASLNGDKYYIDAKHQKIIVSTVVKDAKSGIREIKLLRSDETGETGEVCQIYPSADAAYDAQTGKVTFENVSLSAGDNWFTLVAADNQGNTTTQPVGLYSDNKAVVYDASAPIVETDITSTANTTFVSNPNADPTFYYQNDSDLESASIQIIGEENLGLHSLVVKTGDTEHTVTIDKSNGNKKWMVTLLGRDVKDWLTDGNGDVTIVVRDISGNESTRIVHFVHDNEKAVIASVKVDGNDISAKSDDSYKYYFHASSVTLTADVTDALAGVGEITYTITNINGTTRTGTGAKVNIAAPFKGTVTYTVYDKVNNKSTYQTAGMVVTNGNTSKAALTPGKTDISDGSGNPLYGDNASVGVSVENTYAGIDRISYSVIAPYDVENNTSGVIVPGTAGWKVSRDASGMVTNLAGSIPVTNNSNDIVVSVTVRDMSGVEQTYTKSISIDKTAPVISVSYDNNEADSGNRYRADRTAIIVVRERNFNANDFKLNITNSSGVIPTLSGWSDAADTEDPGNILHIATVTFSADGDYVMDMSYADVTGHAGNSVVSQSFTVDKTAPAISVNFDNDSALNDHYFAQGRTATITVTEHYFDPSRVIVNGVATNDGAGIAFPGISGWSDNGDVHTATIHFTTDGDYQFTVNAADQAGNMSIEYTVPEFVVDQTIPTITFGGVEDQASYNDVVEPTVTFEDVNYDSNNVNVTLVGANQGQVNYGNGAGDSNNGQIISFSDFEHTAEVDDIYTLTATITDMAGNNFEDSITFSVNRFGSNYELDDSLKEIQGKYVKEPIDVVLTETNVNTLTDGSSKIVVSTNGTPKTLTAGTDYQVANAGGGGSWSRYTYTIPKENFAADGTYIVSVYSEDTAGNVNENDAEGKDAEITFGVDGTSPVISMTNLEEDGNYNATSYDATVSVSDNLVLEDVSIQLNGKKIEASVSNDNYTFSIPESSDRQTVTVVATDAAGNSMAQDVGGIIVTTNAFVRFFNNTKVLAGTVVGVLAVGGTGVFVFVNGGIGTLRFRPKKNKKMK